MQVPCFLDLYNMTFSAEVKRERERERGREREREREKRRERERETEWEWKREREREEREIVEVLQVLSCLFTVKNKHCLHFISARHRVRDSNARLNLFRGGTAVNTYVPTMHLHTHRYISFSHALIFFFCSTPLNAWRSSGNECSSWKDHDCLWALRLNLFLASGLSISDPAVSEQFERSPLVCTSLRAAVRMRPVTGQRAGDARPANRWCQASEPVMSRPARRGN